MRAPAPWTTSVMVLALSSGVTASARADDDDARRRAPLPEPIFSETVTDLDADEPGEIELEANGSVLRARRGGASAVDASAEIEWLVTRRLGVRLEPTVSRDSEASAAAIGASAGAAYKLVQDFARELFLDIEALARLPFDGTPIVQPGDPAMPLAFDLRAGTRHGALAVRASAGVGAFGDAAHLPLRGSFALLFPIDPSERFGFVGVEVDADGARRAPLVLALNLVPSFVPAGLPLRVGLALPWNVGERDDRPSFGVFVRIFYESARENAFAAGRGRSARASVDAPFVGQPSPRSSQ